MKKKFIPLVLVLILSLSLIFSACGGFRAIRVEDAQDNFNFVVRSNGGSAVQYGPYIYFINGTRGYEDEDGTQNRWGEVVKGGIYRARLNSEDGETITQTHSPITDILYDFKDVDVTGEQKNYDDEEIDVVPNTRIAPLTAGTSGYAEGGIFIYDEFIYFASPNSQKDRLGVVQTGMTDFMMMSLDGKTVKRVFTTKGEAADQPYGFYKMGDSVYLVCSYASEENSGKFDVVSVRIQNKKVHTPIYLTQKATAVTLPVSDTYDNSIADPQITLMDFVFYTRDFEPGEWPRTGNTIEFCRPDGSEAGSYQGTGKTTAIETVRDGLLFYTQPDDKVTGDGIKVSFTNLHDALMEIEPDTKIKLPKGSKSYRAYEETAAEKRNNQTGDVFTLGGLENYTTRYYFKGAASGDIGAYMLGITSSGVYMISAMADNRYNPYELIFNQSVQMLKVDGAWLYYQDGDNIHRLNIFTKESEQVTDRPVVAAGITMDIVADHIMFFSSYDNWTEGFGYSFFKKLSQVGSTSFFVGTLSEEDKPTEEELEEYYESKGTTEDHEGHNH